jgi:hypothetical protein
MNTSSLSLLSSEQQASLNDELKAVYCLLDDFDQKFFASSFSPKDLPIALARKEEIMKRNQADRERLKDLIESFKQSGEAAGSDTAGDLLGAAGAALGVGAGAAIAATDNTAYYLGVTPADLVDPLRTEFQSAKTSSTTTGRPEALTFTVLIQSNGERVPAMTINLTSLNEGCEVKVNDLTSQGLLETLKDGGGKLLELAQKGIDLLRRSKSMRPDQVIGSASQTLNTGADLAETFHSLKLKERAWKVIKQTAEAVEANYKARLEQERQARAALESAWDNYYNCPTCGVGFAKEDALCRVCGSGRPEAPLKADPRQQ